MRLLTTEIGDWVLRRLGESRSVIGAVAFFAPDARMLEALERVPQLTLVVSNEFTVSDPRSFARLHPRARLAYVDPEDGRLHAKVITGERDDGTSWAVVGSANLTRAGFFDHTEACVAFDSREESTDEARIVEVREWALAIEEDAWEVDDDFLQTAMEVWRRRARYRLVRPDAPLPNDSGDGYWAMKTSPGPGAPSYWPRFLADDVVAIGWADIPIDPRTAPMPELAAAIQARYPDRAKPKSAEQGARMVGYFRSMEPGHRVIICRGYTGTDRDGAPIHLYGLGRVVGEFDWDHQSEWFGCQRAALLQNIDQPVPRRVFTEGLGMGSLRETIHSLDKSAWDDFLKILEDETGITAQV